MFTVEDIDETLRRLYKCGAALVGEVFQYGTRIGSATSSAPEGILVGLAQELGPQASP